MKKYLAYLIVFIAWAAFSLPTRAQYLCQVTVPFQPPGVSGKLPTGIIQYFFTALDCNGNNCIAAGLGLNDTANGYQLVFLHSVDGGFTWTVTNSGFPVQNEEDTYISVIEQIDSLNIIAAGNNGIVFHTSDAGGTWQQQKLPVNYTNATIGGVSFSNPMDGIIATGDTPVGVFFTSDGGNNWTTIPVLRLRPAWRCHDYGEGKYRLFVYYTGQTYTTTDNWQTVDSTEPIIADTAESPFYGFVCNFGGGDTMIAYGNHWGGSDTIFTTPYPLIARTTSGGAHWNIEYDDSGGFIGSVSNMTAINRDTIVAGLSGTYNKIFRSTDRGGTWQVDTLIFTDTNFAGLHTFPGYVAWGIGLNTKGDVAAALGQQGGLYSSMIIGQLSAASVNMNSADPKTQIFPNPAFSSVTITSAEAGSTVHLLDILGREVLHGTVPASGALTLDVSDLPLGIYEVMIEKDGAMLKTSKLAVTK
jgi:Secretion system C-terminal sorting domain/Photosynthesis system II assembly factor YCF48